MPDKRKKTIAYAVFRFTFGVNMLMHGLMRLGPNTEPFINHMTKMFKDSILPQWFVTGYAYTVIPIEILIGISLVLGFFTFAGAAAGELLMSTFIFGACLLQNWSLVGSQMVYVLSFFVLMFFSSHDGLGLDAFLIRRRQ